MRSTPDEELEDTFPIATLRHRLVCLVLAVQRRVAHDAPILEAPGARDGYDALLTPR